MVWRSAQGTKGTSDYSELTFERLRRPIYPLDAGVQRPSAS